MSRCSERRWIDAHFAGRNSADHEHAMHEHLAGCAACRGYYNRIAIAARVDPASLSLEDRIGSGLGFAPRRRRLALFWRRLFPALLAPALAAAALLFYFHPAKPTITAKGGPRLSIFARRADRVFGVRDGGTLRAGDRLRFVVSGAGHPFVLIASVDGAGRASIYYPPRSDASASLAKGSNELPGSVELDDVLGSERLYAVFSDSPMRAADVLRALSGAPTDAASSLPADTLTFHFTKEAR